GGPPVVAGVAEPVAALGAVAGLGGGAAGTGFGHGSFVGEAHPVTASLPAGRTGRQRRQGPANPSRPPAGVVGWWAFPCGTARPPSLSEQPHELAWVLPPAGPVGGGLRTGARPVPRGALPRPARPGRRAGRLPGRPPPAASADAHPVARTGRFP